MRQSLIYGKARRSLGKQLKYHEEAARLHPGWDKKRCLNWAADRAQEKIDQFFAGLPGAKKFIKGTVRQAYEQRYVETILGRRRILHGLMPYDQMLEHAATANKRGMELCWCPLCEATRKEERRSVNTKIQGSAADICMLAMIGIQTDDHLSELGYVQRLQIHDEILGSCPDSTKEECRDLVKWHMENCGLRLSVPLRAQPHWGETWKEAKG